MNRPLDTLLQLVLFQVRAQRCNPVWMVSLATAALLGFSEAFTLGVLDWPTTTQASRAYQLGSVLLFGLMTFLLCAGSLARDLAENHRDLLFSRPVPSCAALPYYLDTYGMHSIHGRAPAMATGSAALAMAVLTRQASAPISMASQACEGLPMPASTTTGTLISSIIICSISRVVSPRLVPMGEPRGMTAAAPAS